ncbi:hypothetical protein IM40_06020 [Candidatus Paracaedimonas acanthamoebae]|nr:hypothetical protein IM40_06020 [Candidatus Paracaedimonas acanthamoebae]
MIENKRIKTDELETYRPHGHPRGGGDLRQPEGGKGTREAYLCVTGTIWKRRGKVKARMATNTFLYHSCTLLLSSPRRRGSRKGRRHRVVVGEILRSLEILGTRPRMTKMEELGSH